MSLNQHYCSLKRFWNETGLCSLVSHWNIFLMTNFKTWKCKQKDFLNACQIKEVLLIHGHNTLVYMILLKYMSIKSQWLHLMYCIGHSTSCFLPQFKVNFWWGRERTSRTLGDKPLWFRGRKNKATAYQVLKWMRPESKKTINKWIWYESNFQFIWTGITIKPWISWQIANFSFLIFFAEGLKIYFPPLCLSFSLNNVREQCSPNLSLFHIQQIGLFFTFSGNQLVINKTCDKIRL